jgi:hypothetical protein
MPDPIPRRAPDPDPNPETHQDYFFPLDTSGDYRWHIQQKVKLAIGRKAIAMGNTADQTFLRFDPPLDPVTELPLIEALFADGSKISTPPEAAKGQAYVMRDVYYSNFLADLEAELGCDVVIWFPRSDTSKKNSDRIELHFSRVLTTSDKNKVEKAISDLNLGWTK